MVTNNRVVVSEGSGSGEMMQMDGCMLKKSYLVVCSGTKGDVFVMILVSDHTAFTKKTSDGQQTSYVGREEVVQSDHFLLYLTFAS